MSIDGVGTPAAIGAFHANAAAVAGSMMKLATGSRIPRASADPAGLIASEGLRAELASLEGERRSLDRADALAFAADGALAEISGLLGDAHAADVAMANTGAMSAPERDAYRMEIDSALQTAQRIAGTATFNGERLFDGRVVLSAGGDSYTIGSPAMPSPAPGGGDAITDAIGAVSTLRGSLGSFQKHGIQARINTNASEYAGVAAANSAIRDTDFAAETATLARARVLERSSLLALGVGSHPAGAFLDAIA